MEGHNLQVAVRVRPIIGKDVTNGCGTNPPLTLSVAGDIIRILDVGATAGGSNPGSPASTPITPISKAPTPSPAVTPTGTTATGHSFSFDKVLWSAPVTAGCGRTAAATQQDVYDYVGPHLITNALDGFNSCLFAYGQTGSGKTHSMIGGMGEDGSLSTSKADDLGVIPRLAADFFNRIATSSEALSIIGSPKGPAAANTSMTGLSPSVMSFRMELSFVEIYCEHARDLLTKSHGTLKVRQSPVRGPYVEDLTSHEVTCTSDLMKLIQQGMKERATAETRMNQRSSRSHAIVQLMVTAMWSDEGKPRQRTSKLNLVDLAGSERVSQSGAVGARFEEARNINQSLTTLGRVIQCLADRQSSTTGSGTSSPNVVIPYRESQLTWLLSDSLGGNSKTMMLATISPTAMCYQQSLNTLRFACVAQKVVNVVRVNEEKDSTEMIEELRDQVEHLTLQLHTAAGERAATALNHRVAALSSDLEKSQDQCRALTGKLKVLASQKEHEEGHQQRKLQLLVTSQATDLNKLRADRAADAHTMKAELARKNFEIHELQELVKKKDCEITSLTSRLRSSSSYRSATSPATQDPGTSSVTGGGVTTQVRFGGSTSPPPQEHEKALRQIRDQAEVTRSLLSQQLSDAKDEIAHISVKYHREQDKRSKAEKSLSDAQAQLASSRESLCAAQQLQSTTSLDSASQMEGLQEELRLSNADLQSATKQLQELRSSLNAAADEATKKASAANADEVKRVAAELVAAQDTVGKLRKHNVKLQTENLAMAKQKEQLQRNSAEELTVLRDDVAELEVLLLEETESSERYFLSTRLLEQAREAWFSAFSQFAAAASADSTRDATSQMMSSFFAEEQLERLKAEMDCHGVLAAVSMFRMNAAENAITSKEVELSAKGRDAEAAEAQMSEISDRARLAEDRAVSNSAELATAVEQLSELRCELVDSHTAYDAEVAAHEEATQAVLSLEADVEVLQQQLEDTEIHFNETIAQLESDHQTASTSLNQELSTLQQNYDALQLEREQLTAELEAKTEDAAKSMDARDGELKLVNERLKVASEEHDLLIASKARIVDLETEVQQKSVQYDESSHKLQSAVAELSKTKGELVQQVARTAEVSGDLEALRLKSVSSAEATARLEAELHRTSEKLTDSLVSSDAASAHSRRLEADVARLATDKATTEETLQVVTANYEKSLQAAHQKLDTTRAAWKELQARHDAEMVEVRGFAEKNMSQLRSERDTAVEDAASWEERHSELQMKLQLHECLIEGEKQTFEDSLSTKDVEISALRRELQRHHLQLDDTKEQLVVATSQVADLQVALSKAIATSGGPHTNSSHGLSEAKNINSLLTPSRQGKDCDDRMTSLSPAMRLSGTVSTLQLTPSRREGSCGSTCNITPTNSGIYVDPDAGAWSNGSMGLERRALRAKLAAEQQLADAQGFNEMIQRHSESHGALFKHMEAQLNAVNDALQMGIGSTPPPTSPQPGH